MVGGQLVHRSRHLVINATMCCIHNFGTIDDSCGLAEPLLPRQERQQDGFFAHIRYTMVKQQISYERETRAVLADIDRVVVDSRGLVWIGRFRDHFCEELELCVYIDDSGKLRRVLFVNGNEDDLANFCKYKRVAVL